MVVNSFNFLLFFVVVFVIYYIPVIRNNPKLQNTWIFLASYFFYGFADWKMIPLLLGATIVFYGIGIWLKAEMDKGHAKNASHITTLGAVLGVGILLYFKYLNFFAESFAVFINAIGLKVSWTTLNIVLPIGVSFFTFKLISYVIEVHREHIQPSRDFIEFGTYVAFFPTILSGPIDRPNVFIPQIAVSRVFNYELAVDGCRQILWGMFTKMCIADNLASITDSVWANIDQFSSSTLLWVVILYPIQMYADFDGYSNMAIGVGKVLGINITRNFNHPFLARNIAEYWRNWHISLTGWLTDYVFSPLSIAFRNWGNLGIILAIVINFLLIGLWHGSNWTFALFGLYHGLLYIPLILSGSFGKKKKLKSGKYGLPQGRDVLKMLMTFILVSLGLIIFKSSSVSDASSYIYRLFDTTVFDLSKGYSELFSLGIHIYVLLFVLLLIITEWTCRKHQYNLEITSGTILSKSKFLRWALYISLLVVTFLCKGVEAKFIYFQF
ncbi:MAG: MBOAT family protein [Prevotella sp.]|jgi:D-alanyl-lipoteichoic acid acyltransferase DltB (MBOAT superfamily)|nr:MBOAT family protein [Prevotella sp.]